jgi:hypothetical protein
MVETNKFVSEGLIEFLQATAPEWATKLTMERLSFVRIIVRLSNLEQAARGLIEDCFGENELQAMPSDIAALRQALSELDEKDEKERN